MDKFFLHLVTVDRHFRLSLVADDRHLRYSFKENNRNCKKPNTLGRCLQQQSVSELKTKSGLKLSSPTRLTRISSFSAACYIRKVGNVFGAFRFRSMQKRSKLPVLATHSRCVCDPHVYVRWRREEGLQNFFWVGSFTIAVIIGGTPHNSSSQQVSI